MLDNETKRRIDSARDILVGKVPNPQSQVEQITIALIYKFMDDMDQESLEMGGEASFFTGEFEKYGWNRIFDARMGGFEMLALYTDAITRMSQNPNLPQLFRDIFKNAFLPYRDPETLKMFLKVINDFKYDHSEKLGDAFEYLLSVLGSQGDAGQFRTPRHIIDFMVDVLNPQKKETVLDPACGTAGFLIKAYKHIMDANMKNLPGDLLTPDERKGLMKNFKGYDISPDMVRLSLVNMYLHGFVQPEIFEYDTLSSEERWSDYADVILANPPFMSPKGGIRPHKRFSVQSNRSEVLFVDYMAEHLTSNGRAAIIVPEGIIFQSAGAYKQLRKYLVENNYLWAVVSLPAGVFNPYAGVKTSILILDRVLAKKTGRILFVKINADGYDLGAQRRQIEANDLQDRLADLKDWQMICRNGDADARELGEDEKGLLLVEKSRLAEDGDYNLSADRYREYLKIKNRNWKMASLGDVCQINPKKSEINDLDKGTSVSFIPMEDLEAQRMLFVPKKERLLGEVYKGYTYFRECDVILAKVTPCFENGKSGIARNLKNGIGFGSSEYFILRASEQILPEYIYRIIARPLFIEAGKSHMTGTGGLQRVPIDFVTHYQIPLPPLDVQREIVAEIEGYQKIVDGARQVVEAWKPNIELELEEERKSAGVEAWEVVKLGEVLSFVGSGVTPLGGKETYLNDGILFIRSQNVLWGICDLSDAAFISQEVHDEMSRSKVKKNDVLLNITGASIGRSAVYLEDRVANVNQHVTILRCKNDLVPGFLMNYLISKTGQNQICSVQSGASRQALNYQQIRELKIPYPPFGIQHAIIKRIEAEYEIVEANRRMIKIYEEKIRKVIERVWEG